MESGFLNEYKYFQKGVIIKRFNPCTDYNNSFPGTLISYYTQGQLTAKVCK